MRKVLRFLPLLLFLALTSACASIAELQGRPLEYGLERIFQAPLTETLAAARLAMPEVGLVMEPDNEVEDGVWMLIGTYGGGPFLDGTFTRAVVRWKSETETSVRIFSEIGHDVALANRLRTEIFESISATLGKTPTSR